MFDVKKIKLFLILIGVLGIPFFVQAQEVRNIIFPVDGPNSFEDTFGAPRSGGRTHIGTDIIADKMTPLVAVTNGYISYLTENEPDWGYSLTIKDNEGYEYKYLHINNDTPGTDDGEGGRLYSFAPTIKRDVEVVAGQFIGYVGDSGNAESTVSHLHFELWTPQKEVVNSYPSLITAQTGGIPGWNYLFENNLELDDKNNDVKQLQQYLNVNGFLISSSGAGAPGNETTYFGPATKAALIAFQEKYNINPAAGYFGPTTRTLINLAFSNIEDPISGIQAGWLIKNKKYAEVFYVDSLLTLHWVVNEAVALKRFGDAWNQDIKEYDDLGIFNLKFGDNLN